MCRRVYLHILDQHRQDHIDEMTYLREKVGLYGYAQLDPLVIYKKEAYEKFQRLLSNIRRNTLAQVFRTDFTTTFSAQTRQQQPQKINMADILKAVTAGLSSTPQTANHQKKDKKEVIELADGEKAEVLESNDDFEVLEIEDDDVSSATPA